MIKKKLAIFVPLIVFISGTIVVFIFLMFPKISPFQEQTFANNVSALAAAMSALAALAIAWYAGLQIFENRRLREENRQEKNIRRLDDVINWARSIAEWNDKDFFGVTEPSRTQLLLQSTKRTGIFTRFRDEGSNIVFPTILNVFEQRQSLISSITELIKILNEFLELLFQEQLPLVRLEVAQAQLSSEDKIKECTKESESKAFEVIITFNKIPEFARTVIKEAIAVKLSI